MESPLLADNPAAALQPAKSCSSSSGVLGSLPGGVLTGVLARPSAHQPSALGRGGAGCATNRLRYEVAADPSYFRKGSVLLVVGQC